MIDSRKQRVPTHLGDRWQKSRHSEGDGACVEVRVLNGSVQLRDSKDPGGPVLQFSPMCWASFVGSLG